MIWKKLEQADFSAYYCPICGAIAYAEKESDLPDYCQCLSDIAKDKED